MKNEYLSLPRTFLTAIDPMEELMGYLTQLMLARTITINPPDYSNRQGRRGSKPLNPRDLSEPKLRTSYV